MNASRTVARNVRRLRLAAGLTQTEAAEKLAALGGPSWSKATWSAMERSVETDRIRAFSADDVSWLACLFGIAPGDLFEEPSTISCPHCDGTGEITVAKSGSSSLHPGQTEIPSP